MVMHPASLEHTGATIIAHMAFDCTGRVCPLHNRSDHAMRVFPQIWRADKRIIMRVCPHGVEHPDPDQFERWASTGHSHLAAHDCDNCCKTHSVGALVTPLWNRRDVVKVMSTVIADMNSSTEDVIPIVDEVSAALNAALPLLMSALADDVKREFDEGSGISPLVTYIERWRPDE